MQPLGPEFSERGGVIHWKRGCLATATAKPGSQQNLPPTQGLGQGPNHPKRRKVNDPVPVPLPCPEAAQSSSHEEGIPAQTPFLDSRPGGGAWLAPSHSPDGQRRGRRCPSPSPGAQDASHIEHPVRQFYKHHPPWAGPRDVFERGGRGVWLGPPVLPGSPCGQTVVSSSPLGTEGTEANFWLSASNIGRGGGGRGETPPPPPAVYNRSKTSLAGPH